MPETAQAFLPLDVGTGRTYRRKGFAPRYELSVNGTTLKEDVLRQVAGVQIEMGVDGADQVTLQVVPVTDQRRVRDLLDGYVFAEGNSLEVRSGDETGPLHHMGRYDLQVSAPRGDERGRVVEVIGYSAAARLLRNQAPWRFGRDVSDQEAVIQIARHAGIEPNVSATLPRKRARVKEVGTSDLVFLDQIAATARNEAGTDFRWYVRWDPAARGGRGADVLTFEPFRLDTQVEQYVFRYEPGEDARLSSTLRRWAIEPAMGDTPSRLSVVYLDRLAGEEREIVVEVADADAEPNVLWSGKVAGLDLRQEIKDGAAVRVQAIGEGTEENPLEFLTFEDETEALDFARRRFRARQLAFANADFTVVGMERILPWDRHTFRGMQDRWDGDYLIMNVIHGWQKSGPYFCDLTANRLPSTRSVPKGGVR